MSSLVGTVTVFVKVCDRGRVDIWQRLCLYKSDGSPSIVYKPSVCLL